MKRNTYSSIFERLSGVCDALVISENNTIDYQNVARSLAVALDVDTVHIYLRVVTGDYFIRCASYSENAASITRTNELISASAQEMLAFIEGGKPRFFDFARSHARDRTSDHLLGLGYDGAVATPIMVGNSTIGFYSITKKRPWKPNDVVEELLMSIGKTISLAVTNASLFFWGGKSVVKMPENLTDRNKEVLFLLSQGLSNAEISSKLFLSEPSVKRQIKTLLEKLNVETRVQAAVLASHMGMA